MNKLKKWTYFEILREHVMNGRHPPGAVRSTFFLDFKNMGAKGIFTISGGKNC